MKDEVREALERYRREAYLPGRFGDPNARNVGYLTGTDGWEDRITLSNAFVEAHPPDDAEPVTEEWLRLVADSATGGADDEPFCAEWFLDGNAVLSVEQRAYHWSAVIDREHDWPRSVERRGDVRRLCSALGVKLAEAAVARTEGR